jgi:hypothetical protein
VTDSSSIEQPAQRRLSRVVSCLLGRRELRTQVARWAELRTSYGIDRVKTEDGIRATYRDDPDAETELRELVAVENACCGWASWEVFRSGGVLVMEARSTGDGVATLHSMLELGPALGLTERAATH